MEQLPNFGDERQTAFCVYCGRDTRTRDHVPPKVFLDEPYPTNLPVVHACQDCNARFSLDEEYVASLIECALIGSVNPNEMGREKVRRILISKPALVARLAQAREKTEGGTAFKIETDRVRNVIIKLGKGHVAFEQNEPQYDDPSSLSFAPLTVMLPDVQERFETPPQSSIWPEVGSRAMQRLAAVFPRGAAWIIAQPGRYRYLTAVGDGVIVRVVLSEYLGCEVVWS